VTTYVNNLRATGATSGSVMTRRTPNLTQCGLASRSSEPKPVPCRRATDAQRWARLDELAEARRQLDEELAILHRELGQDPEPRDQQPAQMVPVQEQPREGNNERQERRPAAEQPRAHAPTPLARGRARDNDRCANEGTNVNAYNDTNALPLFRRASQNLAATTMLLRDYPEAVTSEERRVRQQLKALLEAAAAQQAESSASCQWTERGRTGAPSTHGPNLPPSQHQDRGEGGGAVALAVKSRLGPGRDARNTIDAH
jgi:hypothetical protein